MSFWKLKLFHCILLFLLLRSQLEVCHSCKDIVFFSLAAFKIFQLSLVFFSFSMICGFLFIYSVWWLLHLNLWIVSKILESASNVVCVLMSCPFFLSFWEFWLNKYMLEIFTLSSLSLILSYFSFLVFVFLWSDLHFG